MDNQTTDSPQANTYTPSTPDMTSEPVTPPAAEPPPPFMTDIPQPVSPPPKKSHNFLIAAVLLILVITVPLVVYVAQQPQDIRQRAQTYACNGNLDATRHRECQNGQCVTVDNAAGVCDTGNNDTCSSSTQCTSGGGNNGGNGGNNGGTGGTNVTASPTPTPTPSPSPSPVVNCNNDCSSNNDCFNDNLVCFVEAGKTKGVCRNKQCPTSTNDTNTDCNCESIASTQQSQSPATTPQVPKAGTMWPTVFVVIGGIVLLGLGLAL